MDRYPSTKRLLRQLRLLNQTLSNTYPYAFKIGAWLRVERHQWAAEFAIDNEALAHLPMSQARDYALLEYCEDHHLQELDDILSEHFFDRTPLYLRVELENTVRWYSQQAETRILAK